MNRHFAKISALLLSGALLLAGCGGIDKAATLVTINGGEDTITLGYGNFVARMAQAQYDLLYRPYYGDTYWSQSFSDGTMEASVKADVLESLEEDYLAGQHAEALGISVSEEQQQAIEDAVAEFMADNTAEGLKQLGATEEYVRKYLTDQTFTRQVRAQIRGEIEVDLDEKDYLTKDYTYVYFNLNGHYDSTYTNWVTLTEEEQEQLAVDAQTLADADPEDFNDVANDLGQSLLKQTYTPQDLGSEDYALDQAVLEAAETLNNGETSDVIEVEGMGYYVIRMDDVADAEGTAEAMEEAEEDLRDAHYDEVLEGWKSEITWEVNEENWAKVTFTELFEELPHEHEEEVTDEAAAAEDAGTADAEDTDETETGDDSEAEEDSGAEDETAAAYDTETEDEAAE